jgi:hypothetical protein
LFIGEGHGGADNGADSGCGRIAWPGRMITRFPGVISAVASFFTCTK